MPTINHTADGTNEAIGADILGIDARTLTSLTITVAGASASWQINATPVTNQHLLNISSTTEFYTFSRQWLDAHRGELDDLTLKGTITTTTYAITYAVLPG